ncbi:TetR/AcrR family transcriptional regulator [Apibacter sp. HY039]|uniref:TetR/AcrR family transcriptional regulator n=1 Tax=Apibacter sp. HY039 TaxID=2501476 RepID=UPI0013E334A1|nr:TetR/AcrR family transcriptional regulator [Apibacter sp. HY039]
MKKKNKTDWLLEGLKVLEEKGFNKLTIEELCVRLNLTKGSFYHHFKNIENYVESLMIYWKEENTLSFINKVNTKDNFLDKYYYLKELVANASHKKEQVIRGWSYSNPIVKFYLQQVDSSRLSFLKELRQIKGESKENTDHAAMLEYATLIGIQQLFPDITKEELQQLQKFYDKI